MKEKVYWIWLQQVLGYANKNINELMKKFSSPEEIYKMSYKEKLKSSFFTTKSFERLKVVNIDDCVNILNDAEKSGQCIITFNDRNYPQKLKNIFNPPCLLYVKGEIPSLDNKLCVTIVGTRRATNYGMNMAFDFAYKLAKSEAIIISGGAVGIDIQSHKAMLKANGTGICILGCGIDYPYLEENKEIRQEILKNGALVSEFSPKCRPFAGNFPLRNRLMAALADAVLVIEAGKRSGALITANLALEYGKEIFAVPGNINSRASAGTNEMVRDGAKIALSASDILDDFHLDMKFENVVFDEVPCKSNACSNLPKDEFESKLKEKTVKLSLQNQKVYDTLSKNPIALEMIIYKTQMKIQEVLSSLTELEILDLVKSYPGKRYSLL